MADRISPDDPDEGLLRALREPDDAEAVFRELFTRYRRPLASFFSRRGFSDETARDLSQEVFLRVFRSRRSFRGEVPLTVWIFRIADRLGQNERRRRGAEKRSGRETSLDAGEDRAAIEIAVGGADPTAPPPAVRGALAREQLAEMRRAIGDLPPRMRDAMVMSLDHDVEEIALAMSISESTVKVHLHQARKRLREALRARFGSTPS